MPASYKRLIVPVNGKPSDQRVLTLVGESIQHQHVAVTLIYVVEVQQSMPLDAELPAEIDRGEEVLRRAEEMAKAAIGHKIDRLTTDLLQARSASSAIVDEAIERNADAIVMASTLRIKHGKPTLGETTGYVLKNAPCEVVVIRIALPD